MPFQIFGRGQLIEICGIDGAGKTTFAEDLQEALIQEGREVVVIRPTSGDSEYLNKLNALVSSATKERIERFKSEYFIFNVLANQALIADYLDRDIDVICDRYIFSFITYRICFNQFQEKDLPLLEECLKADHIFLVTIPLDVSEARIGKRAVRAAHENHEFLSKAQDHFLKNASHYSNLTFLDGANQRQDNVKMALKYVSPVFQLGQRGGSPTHLSVDCSQEEQPSNAV